MKKLVCQECCSGELVKKNGMYICEYCGTKYEEDEKSKTEEDLCKLGTEAYSRGEIENAKELFMRAVESGDIRAYEILGDIHMKNKNYKAAIICYEKAKDGGSGTATFKLKNATDEKEGEEFFKNFFENEKEGENNIDNTKNTENTNKQKEEPVQTVIYNLEENKTKAVIQIILYIVAVAVCVIGVINSYKAANLWVMLIFGFVGLIIGAGAIDAFATRCPKCAKLNAMVTISSVVTGQENISKVKRVKDYNSKGQVIGSHDQWVSGVRTFTHDVDRCKYCKYKRVVDRSNDSV